MGRSRVLGWETADQLAKKRIAGSAQRKPTQEVPWNMFYWFLTTSEKKQEFKVQTPHRRGSFLGEAHTGYHALNGLAFGLAQKVEGFAVSLIGIAEFSPESFHDVVVFIANTIP